MTEGPTMKSSSTTSVGAPAASAAATATKSAAGLQGVIAAPSAICFIDGNAGRLVYRGYEITDLVGRVSFEETAFLLWDEKLPSSRELAELKRQLGAASALPAHGMAVLAGPPGKSPTVDALGAACRALGAPD